MSKGHVDAAARGAFLSLTITNVTSLIEKMVANQSRGEEQKQQKGMHTVKETDMLATKMDLLLKRLDEHASNKEATKGTVKAMDSQMTCEVCGKVGHSWNNYPEIRNGFRQGKNNGWNNQSRPQGGNSNFNTNYNSNQPSLKDLVLG